MSCAFITPAFTCIVVLHMLWHVCSSTSIAEHTCTACLMCQQLNCDGDHTNLCSAVAVASQQQNGSATKQPEGGEDRGSGSRGKRAGRKRKVETEAVAITPEAALPPIARPKSADARVSRRAAAATAAAAAAAEPPAAQSNKCPQPRSKRLKVRLGLGTEGGDGQVIREAWLNTIPATGTIHKQIHVSKLIHVSSNATVCLESRTQAEDDADSKPYVADAHNAASHRQQGSKVQLSRSGGGASNFAEAVSDGFMYSSAKVRIPADDHPARGCHGHA